MVAGGRPIFRERDAHGLDPAPEPRETPQPRGGSRGCLRPALPLAAAPLLPCTDRKRWACAADVNLRICRSRWRVGWGDTSARLFSYSGGGIDIRNPASIHGMRVAGDYRHVAGVDHNLTRPELTL